MPDDAEDQDERNGKLNLSHLTPEEIARQVLTTPPPPETEEAKERARRRRKAKDQAVGS